MLLIQPLIKKLERLESSGVIHPVSTSEWAAPIVPVPKKDGRIRICGDFKVTINPVLDVEQYPLPKPQDLFATLSGGEKFTKLDLQQAYLQLQLEEESRKVCDDKHSPWPVWVHSFAIRCGLCPCPVPKESWIQFYKAYQE